MAADTDAPAADPDAPRLKRQLGLLATTLSGVGIILGAGIYVIIAEAAQDAGSAVWLSFGLAAAVAAATGLSYAELSSMFPEAGASSTYAHEAFGRRVGFLVGWLRIFVGTVGAAAVAIGFGGYMQDLSRADATPMALLVIFLSGGIVILGTRETVAVAIAMTLAEVTGLILVITVGLPDIGSRSLLDNPDGVIGIAAGTALVFFAFEGFEQIATLSEETRRPTWTIPRAIVLAIAISAVLYVLVSLIAVSVLDWRVLADSEAPLADVVSAASSDRLGDALSIIALFATGNTVLMLIATASRLSYGMARRGLLPPMLSTVGGRRTPWVAAALVTAGAALIALPGDIGLAAQITNFAVFGAFIVVNASLIRLRFSRPTVERPFRAPGTIRGVAITAVAAGAGCAALTLSLDLDALLGGLAVLAAGAVASQFAMRERFRGGAPPPA